MSAQIYCNVFFPHPLLFVLCVCEQLPDVGLRLSNILVENLRPVDDLRLPGLEHLANLSSHQGFAAAWGSEQEDSLHMLTAWRHGKGKRRIRVILSSGSECFHLLLSSYLCWMKLKQATSKTMHWTYQSSGSNYSHPEPTSRAWFAYLFLAICKCWPDSTFKWSFEDSILFMLVLV